MRGPLSRPRREARRADLTWRRAWAERLNDLADALGRPRPGLSDDPSTSEIAKQVAASVRTTSRQEIWLALAVMSGQLPLDETVTGVCRRCELSGDGRPLWDAIFAASTPESMRRPVRILVDTVVVDVHHTVRTKLATGIQRVAREVASRWASEHDCTFVAWNDNFRSMRLLTALEAGRVAGGGRRAPRAGTTEPLADDPQPTDLVVPWRSTYLLPELVADRERNKRTLAMARHGLVRTGVVGFDCIPITSGDTSAGRVPDFFADHLATVRHFDKIATISQAAGDEYGGWRSMLGAIGMTGPEIRPVMLPAETPPSTSQALQAAAHRFVVAGLPLVLCVGTHEPRKNHHAVLHAAEVLWQEGHRFSLTFVGGHAWRSTGFRRELERLQSQGHPVESAAGVGDALLWAAYRVAHCTVFPSLNEGFGLPVAESLAAGTPAITSAYGSMREIAAAGGALLVDPRDDASVTGALRTMLTDEGTVQRLRREAAARPPRSWNDYARETWTYLTSD